MVEMLPPAKGADEYTLEEKRQIIRDAQVAAEKLMAYIRRLAEIDAHEGGGGHGGDGGIPLAGHPSSGG